MLSISLNELVYDLIELYRANHKNTDSLSEEQVRNWIHATRAAIVKSRLDQNPFYIDQSWVQDLGNVEVEGTTTVGGITYVKTRDKLPLTINRRGGEGTFTILSPGEVGITPYNYVSYDRSMYAGNGAFNSATKYAFLYDGYLYIKNETLASIQSVLGHSTNYFTGWTNGDYDTFTTSTTVVSSAINAAGTAYGTSNSITLSAGDEITFTSSLTLNSGEAPTITLMYGVTSVDAELLASGSNSVTFVATSTGTHTLKLTNTGASNYALSAATVAITNYIRVKGVFFNPELAATFAGLTNFENDYDYPIDQSIITTMQNIIKKENFNFIMQQLEDKKADGVDTTTK